MTKRTNGVVASKQKDHTPALLYFRPMGKAQFQQHDTAAAVRLLRQAVEMNPEDAGSYYLLARAFRSQGNAPEADAAMQRVVQLHTSSLDAEKRALQDAGVVGAR